jgi:hypothetical protein
MSIKSELRSLERERARLMKREKSLLEQSRAQKDLASKLETLVKGSGLAVRDLVFALVEHFGVRLAGRRKGQKGRRRRRTKITAELRDAVKKAVKGGASMNRTSKEFGISYAVVVKMIRGHYDKVK